MIIDDNQVFSRGISLALSQEYQVYTVTCKKDALAVIDDHFIDLILLDLHLPPLLDRVDEGMDLLLSIKEITPQSVTIVMTGDREKSTAIEAIERGAYDYFQKPINISELMIIIKRALKKRELESENLFLRQQLVGEYYPKNIIGASPRLKQLLDKVERIASSQAAVLILGESGTGKELIARALHYLSERRDRPFVEVNCSAFPESLLESELFGHEKGAFTGAITQRPGRFELAHRGTLFLDEIGDLSETIQIKLLRILQEKKFQRLGGKTAQKSDFRLITATNQDLKQKIEQGTFREDFYFRLNVVQLTVPPLRERKEDITLLVDYFIKKFNKMNGRSIKGCSQPVLDFFMNYHLPGNVRELENIIEGAVVLCKNDYIEMDDLPASFHSYVSAQNLGKTSEPQTTINFEEAVRNFEHSLLKKTLNETSWNKTQAAKKLGLKLEQIKYLCRKYNLFKR
ncbi:sigma-54-dependent transcriptional regulator [candidate division CSSED10-310 bacterium]|uniref:Sigma-54-dependent transcriptional regulator n=1 Tax=candidate division CSSED10-310 bacterium TaxID=2855610 RepID=A0ABV6YTT3_UNCC1